MITMQLMGKNYSVPSGLTIMAAIEYAGYKLVRGSGCRGGFCGACPTLYRKADSHKLHTALACQTLIEDGMCLVQMPFVPIATRRYNIQAVAPAPNLILQYYPEVAGCVACNTCTRACPQGISVMDYIQAALRGDIERTAMLSFDCISCGICSSRCPADIKHYAVAQLARRVYGKYISPASPHLAARIAELEACRFQPDLDELMRLPLAELRLRYEQRTFEAVAGGSQQHSANQKLGSAVDPVDYQDEVTP
jgi:ferredoxin